MAERPGRLPRPACADHDLTCPTVPFTQDQLDRRYLSRGAYVDAYSRATDEAIDAGFVLGADRNALIAAADPSPIGG